MHRIENNKKQLVTINSIIIDIDIVEKDKNKILPK